MSRYIQILTFFAFALFAKQQCFAQTGNDSAGSITDTVKPVSKFPTAADTIKAVARSKRFQPNPKKAGLYSAIVPGLGQAYNRNYWKVPVVYVGIGVAGYFYFNNLNKYQSYRQEYINRTANPSAVTINPEYKNYDKTQILQLQNDAKKYLDMTVLFSGIGYALQIIDAVTSAHLKNFDISRDISMQVYPTVVPGGSGLGLVVNF